MKQPKIYTRTGDSGLTGLRVGGRVRKDSDGPEAFGSVDEAQAAIGVARAVSSSIRLSKTLERVQRDLWVVMTELSTGSEARMSLVPGSSAVSEQMVTALEHELDRLRESSEMPSGFVLPGEAVLSASLDFARTVVRRAERRVLPIAVDGSMVIAYLNRLSDLLWALARDSEGQPRLARSEEATDPPSI